jgi:DNA-binding response OmpR family regulator
MALENFKPSHYDLILLDIKMPEMSGFELCARLRKSDPKARVCFLTAFESSYHNDTVQQQYFPEIEVDCYIHKPITIENLLGKVNSMLTK